MTQAEIKQAIHVITGVLKSKLQSIVIYHEYKNIGKLDRGNVSSNIIQ